MEDNQLTQADDSAEGEDKAGTETVDGIPPATSDDTYPAEDGNNGTTEDPSNENPSNEGPSNEEPSNKDSSNEEPSNENPSQVTADQITIGENDSLTPEFSFVQDYTAEDATAAQKTVTFKNNVVIQQWLFLLLHQVMRIRQQRRFGLSRQMRRRTQLQ